MSEEHDSPRLNGIPMVQIPVALHELLCACYYGGGPNHWEKTGKVAPSARNRTFEQRQTTVASDDDEDFDEGRLANPSQPVMIPLAPPGLRAQGAAHTEFMSAVMQLAPKSLPTSLE